MRPLVLALALAFVAVAGCAAREEEGPCPPDRLQDAPLGAREPMCFVTADGWRIRGVVEAGGAPAGPIVVLTHGLGEDRSAFDALADALRPQAGAVVRMDLRGHGESAWKDGATREWRNLTAEDFDGMDYDVTGSVAKGLLRRGDRPIVHVGADVGANLALRDAAGHPGAARAVVLLSPGLDYHGVSAEGANAEYAGRVLFVASAEDAYAVESAETLARKGAGEVKDVKLWEGNGHGTTMLDAEGRAFVVAWLGEQALREAR